MPSPASLPADREAGLRSAVLASGLDDRRQPRAIASLLGLAMPRRSATLADLGPMQRRQRTLDALVAWLHGDAAARPVVLVVEDLHWTDPSSRDLFGLLLERIADAPVLLVMTFRPEFVPPWPLRAQVSTIALRGWRPARCSRSRTASRRGWSCPPRSSRRSCGAPTACRCSSRS